MSEWWRFPGRRGPKSGSPQAYLFAALCVAIAAIVRFGFGYIDAQIVPFVTFYPAVALTALWAGLRAGIFAIALTILVATFLFIPPYFSLQWPGSADVVNLILFFITSLLVVFVIDAYRRVSQRYSLLLEEMSHRGKNMAAIVEAIIVQSLEGETEKAKTITERIRAVALTNDMLAEESTHAVGLRRLIDSKLRPFGRGTLHGPEILLPAEQARSLALIFHELTVNALKYGCLGRPEGQLSVEWTLSDGNVLLSWKERSGAETQIPERHGFGSKLITRLVKTLGGELSADFQTDGLLVTLRFPHSRE